MVWEAACIGARSIWQISVPTPQFCCKPKTPLKSKSQKKFFKQ